MKARVVVLTNADELSELSERVNREDFDLVFEPYGGDGAVDDLVGRIASLRCELVVFGFDLPEQVVLAASTALTETHPEIGCVAYRSASPEFILRALRSGLGDVINPDHNGHSELIETLRRMLKSGALRRERMSIIHGADDDGRIITVIGPKGGVGKSTIAVNLACALATDAPNEVVLVDLDLQGGDVAEMLRLEVTSNVAMAARSGALRDPATLKLSLTAHSAGMLVLPAPTSLVEAGQVDLSDLAELLELLGQLFRFVIVDTGPGAPDAVIAAVKSSGDVIAVVSSEVGGIRSLGRYLVALEEIGLQWPRTHFVLNRLDRRAGMTREDVEATLGQPVDVVVEYERSVPAAGNQGVPYIQTRPRGRLTAGIAQLVDRLATTNDADVPVVARKGRFR